jgi:hypothetical protein
VLQGTVQEYKEIPDDDDEDDDTSYVLVIRGELLSTFSADNAFTGMTVTVSGAGSVDITGFASSTSTLSLNKAFGKPPAQGASFTISSVWNPPQTAFACEAEDDTLATCGDYKKPVGQYVVPDTNYFTARRVEGKFQIVCKYGFRAVSINPACELPVNISTCAEQYACHAGNPDCAAQEDGREYTRECVGCTYAGEKICSPVQCAPHEWNAESEISGMNLFAMFGQDLTIECNTGYRVAPALVGDARGVSTKTYTKTSYQRSCGLRMPANVDPVDAGDADRQLQPSNVSCQVVTCGLLQLPINASVDMEAFEAGDFNMSGVVIHSDPFFPVRCNPGYKIRGTVSTSDAPCTDSFKIQCVDGQFMYMIGQEEEGAEWTVDAPVCVRIGCGRETDRCRTETCRPMDNIDPNVNASLMSPEFVDAMGTQTVCMCVYACVCVYACEYVCVYVYVCVCVAVLGK